MEKFDYIIMGSGAGGLSAASILSQMGKRVLVVERHFKAGGYTHSFKRKGFSWSPGIHFIGKHDEGEFLHRLLKYLTAGKVEWTSRGKTMEFRLPGLNLKFSNMMEGFQESLIENFPDEKHKIQKYFLDIDRLAKAVQVKWFSENLLRNKDEQVSIPFELKELTLKEYFDQNDFSEQLRAVCSNQVGNYGVFPDKASLIMHALETESLKNGFYEFANSDLFRDSIQPLIRNNGGEVKLLREVTRINFSGDRSRVDSISVKNLKSGDEESYRADKYISAMGVRNTFPLLGVGKYESFLSKFDSLDLQFNIVQVFVGLKDSPESLGIDAELVYLHKNFDSDWGLVAGDGLDSSYKHLFIAFSKFGKGEGSCCQIMGLAKYDHFARWNDSHWNDRPRAYRDLKERIKEVILSRVDEEIPGFRGLVEHIEVSTPLTFNAMANTLGGNIYGVPPTVDRFSDEKVLKAKTDIENLFLAGSDIGFVGVYGAVLGGVASALEAEQINLADLPV